MAIWPFTKKRIYLDHAAATPLDLRVEKVMREVPRSYFGNPSAVHKEGREARMFLEEKRMQFAKLLGAHTDELVWTSGGTEGNTLAISGALLTSDAMAHGKHMVISSFEHPSASRVCEMFARKGWEVTQVAPNKDGIIEPAAVARAVRPDTVLVSVMHAQNELGTVQPIAEIVRLLRRIRKSDSLFPLFHTDACQTIGHVPIDLARLGVDLATFSAHKMYGPRGIGALYVRRGTPFETLSLGGGQESGFRSGTENVAGAAGMTEALTLASCAMEDEMRRLLSLREYLTMRLEREIAGFTLNGSRTDRLPQTLNFSLDAIDSEELVLRLDAQGVAVSSGSACSTGDLKSSYAILALGKSEQEARRAVRVSLGRNTTRAELDFFVEKLKKCVVLMRNARTRGLISDELTNL